jgi:hypothetical protein
MFAGRAGGGELALRLRSSVPLQLEQGAAVAEFTLGADKAAWFVLEVVLPNDPSPCDQPDYESIAFKETVNFWRRIDRPLHVQGSLDERFIHRH